jgi:protocatechuate 3,4-dioxygenase beta subunit
MSERVPVDLVRRRLMQAMLAMPAFTLVGCGAEAVADAVPTAPSSLNPTPACDDGDDDPTPAQTEGPYFTSNSPVRSTLVEAGMAGTLLTLSGRVLTTSCQPISQAKLDFWQADNAGAYDNAGYRLRGHQFTDQSGRFTLQTIVPGLYPGRTRHIHVKVQAPNGPVLTTQLYFPGEARNASDGIYSADLLMAIEDVSGGKSGAFDFVVRA